MNFKVMRLILSLLLVLKLNITFAQAPRFVAKGTGNASFVMHTVQPKENWYSIGRIYAISPKEIAPFNGLTLETSLRIGQELKIPLEASNFDQETDGSSGPSVVHVVDSKETLYHIASEFGVSVDKLKKWNGLKSDQVKPGSEIIVGFIHSTGNTVSPASAASASAVPAKAETSVPVVKPAEEKMSVPVKQPEPKQEIQSKSTPKPVISEKANVMPATTPVDVKNSVGIGFFSVLYQQQSKEGKVQGLEGFVYGFFKSTSGWEDQKYYVLLNDVVPGTIVKINVRGTDKSIFAKVLGSVPVGKESEGMSMRMSNASAAALGLEDTSSGLILSWFK